MELTPEMLLKLHPATYWAVHRAGFAEAKNDPEIRKQIAEEYLRGELTRASPVPAREALARPVVISPEQARVNAQLGLSDEQFVTYAHEAPSRLDPVQAEVNKALGLRESDYLKYAK